MQTHSKTYEDVFSSDRVKSRTKLNLDKISTGEMELNEYVSQFQEFLTNFYLSLFLGCVKLSWLRRKFSYYGRKTVLPMQKNSRILNTAFVKLLRRNVGKDIQIITRGKFFAKLELYFDEFFPDFESENPFENPDYYIFPFKNISMDYLMVVYQLDDRIGLLQKADDGKMSYATFMDYVINYVYTENEILGRDRYEIRHNQDRNFPFHVKDSDKDLQAKRGKKRT